MSLLIPDLERQLQDVVDARQKQPDPGPGRKPRVGAVFTFAAVMFAAALLVGGRLQDRFGPFWIALTGSLLFTLSFFVFSFTSSQFLISSSFF